MLIQNSFPEDYIVSQQNKSEKKRIFASWKMEVTILLIFPALYLVGTVACWSQHVVFPSPWLSINLSSFSDSVLQHPAQV